MNVKEYKDVVGKFHPKTYHESTDREQRYRCTLSLISALEGKGVVNANPQPL